MTPHPVDPKAPDPLGRKKRENRKAGRLGLEMLHCQYGPVVNLSIGGMRVHCRRIPTDVEQIVLMGVGNPIMLKARVAWAKRTGLFKHEVGFEFLDITPDQRAQLTKLATVARDRRSI